jgi:hypothetical protein
MIIMYFSRGHFVFLKEVTGNTICIFIVVLVGGHAYSLVFAGDVYGIWSAQQSILAVDGSRSLQSSWNEFSFVTPIV